MFLGQLVELASQCPDDVMPVVLDALCQVAKADRVITGQLYNRLVPLTMELFKKYSHGEEVWVWRLVRRWRLMRVGWGDW